MYIFILMQMYIKNRLYNFCVIKEFARKWQFRKRKSILHFLLLEKCPFYRHVRRSLSRLNQKNHIQSAFTNTACKKRHYQRVYVMQYKLLYSALSFYVLTMAVLSCSTQLFPVSIKFECIQPGKINIEIMKEYID